MKHLLIMRHAKSSWDNPDYSDHDRPLNARGKRDAPRMGTFLKEQGLCPDFILCSSAKRAKQTAKAVAKAAGFSGEILYSQDLYLATTDDYVRTCQALPDGVARVLVVAHNPGSEEVVRHLTGNLETMPTAAVAELALPLEDWKSLSHETRGTLRHVWRPKELED